MIELHLPSCCDPLSPSAPSGPMPALPLSTDCNQHTDRETRSQRSEKRGYILDWSTVGNAERRALQPGRADNTGIKPVSSC